MYYSEDNGNTGAQEQHNGDDVFSRPVRAGKRTYFFDVKATRSNDYYLTITESKRRMDEDGKFTYDKHKIFLYKEDFDKFAEGLKEAVDFIKAKCSVSERVFGNQNRTDNDQESSVGNNTMFSPDSEDNEDKKETVKNSNDGNNLSRTDDEIDPVKKFSDVDFDNL
ncbi:MAG: PUR family DNA/RNA-binding protein [Bacteroidales bacterium]|jgi:hypothetical protein|nr:PUR family DNA/RNA-binding protein [Bacteroidales bacterium]